LQVPARVVDVPGTVALVVDEVLLEAQRAGVPVALERPLPLALREGALLLDLAVFVEAQALAVEHALVPHRGPDRVAVLVEAHPHALLLAADRAALVVVLVVPEA